MSQKVDKRQTSTIIDESSKRPRTVNTSAVAKPDSKLKPSMVKKTFLGLPNSKSRTDIRDYLWPATLSSGTLDTYCSSPFSSITKDGKKKRRLKFNVTDTRECRTKTSINQQSISQLTQRTIVNVDRDIVTCKVCGMVYTFWEEKSHCQFHKTLSVEFQQLNKYKKATIFEQEFEGKMLCIQVLDRNSEKLLQNIGETALKYSSDNGLEMEPIESKKLWGLITNPHDPNDPDKVLHFKLYVMFHQFQLVALLLAERIGYAVQHCERILTSHNDISRRNIDEASCRDEGDVSFYTHQKVLMSVERIWVRHDYQHKGLATLITDKARENFLHPLVLPKHQIAISWPTRDGLEFFKNYFRGIYNISSFDRLVPYLINAADSTWLT